MKKKVFNVTFCSFQLLSLFHGVSLLVCRKKLEASSFIWLSFDRMTDGVAHVMAHYGCQLSTKRKLIGLQPPASLTAHQNAVKETESKRSGCLEASISDIAFRFIVIVIQLSCDRSLFFRSQKSKNININKIRHNV